MKHLVDFSRIEWTMPSAGVRYKVFIHNNQKIRFIEFSEGFVEPDWCKNGHAGYVLDGECDIDFDGDIEHYEKGDLIFIPEGEADKHILRIGKGGWVQMLLFESILTIQ